MKDKILYFPATTLPGIDWTIKSLLYWDRVGVIVPERFIDEPNLHNPQMRQLVQDGAIVQHFPERYTNLQYSISESVLRVVRDAKYLQDFAKRRQRVTYWKIYTGKFSEELFAELRRLNFAERTANGQLYMVEERTAGIMMSYLAAAMASKIKYQPITDEPEYIGAENHQALVSGDRHRIRTYLLENIMPYPKTTDFNAILRFKDRYHDDLIRFRRNIEDVVETAWSIENPATRAKNLDKNIKKINDRKEILVARMKEKSFNRVALGAVKGMIVDAAIAVITGDVISPAATLASGGYDLATSYQYNPVAEEDLAFLALMQRRFTRFGNA